MITDDFSDNIIPGFTQTVNGVFHKHFKISRKPYTLFFIYFYKGGWRRRQGTSQKEVPCGQWDQ